MPEVGVTTLSFHPWDVSAGTLVSELVPNGRSKVLSQTPGRGSLPAAGDLTPEDCSEATPGGRGAPCSVCSCDHPLSSASPWGGGLISACSLSLHPELALPLEAGLRWDCPSQGRGLAARAETTGRVAAGSGDAILSRGGLCVEWTPHRRRDVTLLAAEVGGDRK